MLQKREIETENFISKTVIPDHLNKAVPHSGHLEIVNKIKALKSLQDSIFDNPVGNARIDDFPVNLNSYNVLLYNVELENMEDARGLCVEISRGPSGEKITVT